MSRLTIFFIVLSSFIIGFSTGIIVSFYKPSFYVKKVITADNSPSPLLNEVNESIPVLEKLANTTEKTPPSPTTQNRLQQLKSLIPKFYKNIKEGINLHPALVFKVEGTDEGTSIHLLTFSPMEWDFIKTNLRNDVTLERPNKVYLCENGIIDVNYVVRGFWPPEVEKGQLEDKNVLVIPQKNGTFAFEDFNGNCTDNGFVFNYSGEFAGVCFGGNFIDANSLYNSVPSNCKLIYPLTENDTNSTENKISQNLTSEN